jgi:hypothetical protein
LARQGLHPVTCNQSQHFPLDLIQGTFPLSGTQGNVQISVDMAAFCCLDAFLLRPGPTLSGSSCSRSGAKALMAQDEEQAPLR